MAKKPEKKIPIDDSQLLNLEFPEPVCALFVLAHPFEEGAAKAPAIRRKAHQALTNAGLTVVGPAQPLTDIAQVDRALEKLAGTEPDCVVLLPATWSDDFLATRILTRLNLPAVTWAIPDLHSGSLCGAQQIDCVLHELGFSFRFVHGLPADQQIAGQVAGFALSCRQVRRLKTVRLARIGSRTFGMTEIAVDELALRETFGAELIEIPLHRFEKTYGAIPKKEALALWKKTKSRAARVQVDDRAGLDACTVALAVEKWMKENLVQALAVDCYPDRMGVFCLAASLLAETGKIVACEADVHAAMLQLIMQELTGRPTQNTDLLHVFEQDDSILAGHCGNGAFCLADPDIGVSLAPARLAGSGCCCQFPARPSEVTLVNLVGRRGSYRMIAVEGRAVETTLDFPGNPLRVRLPVTTEDFLQTVAENGAGHHWVAGLGNVAGHFADICSLTGVDWTEI